MHTPLKHFHTVMRPMLSLLSVSTIQTNSSPLKHLVHGDEHHEEGGKGDEAPHNCEQTERSLQSLSCHNHGDNALVSAWQGC